VLIPNILSRIQLHQGIGQILTAIPEVIFLIGVERDDDISRMVDVGGGFGGHIYWLSFSFCFISIISVGEYIGNNGQGKKEKGLIFIKNVYCFIQLFIIIMLLIIVTYQMIAEVMIYSTPKFTFSVLNNYTITSSPATLKTTAY
jgi:hypothetical protein